MGGGQNKVFLSLKDRPILAYCLDTLNTSPLVGEIILVTGKEDISFCRRNFAGRFKKIAQIVAGGEERQDSVRFGLAVAGRDYPFVAVHDGARPFFSLALLERLIEAAGEYGAAVPALPVKETIKLAGPGDMVQSTLDRARLWAVQTPQVFRREILIEAHNKARDEGWQATDDAALVECCGYPVKLVLGEPGNIKITTPEDLIIARAFLEAGVFG